MTPGESDDTAAERDLQVPTAACASRTVNDYPAEFRGYKRLADAIPRLPNGRTPDSVTVRRQGPNRANVRMKAAHAPSGIQLQVFIASREDGRWKVGGATEGPLGCDSLEKEFAQPGERLAMSTRIGPSTEVVSVRFAIVPEDGPWGSQAGEGVTGAVRTFAPVGENWAPGEHAATATWDGRDDHGRPVASGRYRLVAVAITNGDRDVRCRDGSGRGIEKFAGTWEGGGLGLIEVDRQR